MSLYISTNNMKKNRVFDLSVACTGRGHESERIFVIFYKRSQSGISPVCPRIIIILHQTLFSCTWPLYSVVYERRAADSLFSRTYNATCHVSLNTRPQNFGDFSNLKTLALFYHLFREISPV